MKEFGELMKRLQKIMPANVKPAFTTGEELLAWATGGADAGASVRGRVRREYREFYL